MMNQVLVVSVRKGFQMVTLGTWGNPDGIFGGFANNPKEYQIRRFLKKVDAEAVNQYPYSETALVKPYIKSLDIELDLPEDRYLAAQGINQDDHWVPNTDEYTHSFKVNISAKDDTNQTISLDTFDHQIKLISPEDLTFNSREWEADGSASNIYANKGSGFRFAAYGFSDGEYRYFWLAEVSLKSKIEIQEEYAEKDDINEDCDFYNVIYNSEYIDSTGMGLNGFSLSTHGGELYFKNSDLGISIKDFAIMATGKKRPGDDFLLRFALSSDDTSRGTVAKKDFLAIYDKKLLWRANLYIDEGEGADWNELNPWNSPENEWNKVYSFNSDGLDIQSFAEGDGGQVINFHSWTKYNEGKFNVKLPGFISTNKDDPTYTLVTNSVAYTSNDTDTPFRFNWEMDKQKEALLALNKGTGTIASGNDWNNYIGHIITESNISTLSLNYSTERGIDWRIQAGGNYEPYRPNYSAILNYGLENWVAAQWNPATSQSAGLDCGAIIWVAMTYQGNSYKTVSYDPTYGLDWGKSNPGSYSPSWYSPRHTDNPQNDWQIFTHELLESVDKYNEKEDNKSTFANLIPGDVVVFEGKAKKKDDNGKIILQNGEPVYIKTFPHAAMVLSIRSYTDDKGINFDDIIFIEAASGFSREYRVLNTQSFWGYINNSIENNNYALYFDFNRLNIKE